MAISFKQLIAPAQVDDVEAAQRRQAIAEAMQQRAMQPNLPQVGGPVQAKYGAGNALVDLANSLASAWNLKNANTALGRAKEARGEKIGQAIQDYSRSVPDSRVPAAAQQQLRATPDGELMQGVMGRTEAANKIAGTMPGGREALAGALMEKALKDEPLPEYASFGEGGIFEKGSGTVAREPDAKQQDFKRETQPLPDGSGRVQDFVFNENSGRYEPWGKPYKPVDTTPNTTIRIGGGNGAPPRWVQAQDPNDPRILRWVNLNDPNSAGPPSGKETASGERENDRQFAAQGINDAMNRAEAILKGQKLGPDGQVLKGEKGAKPTESYIGAGVDAVGQVFGAAPSGSEEADQLAVVGGVLTSKIPRFEGPQSNYDVQMYQTMAARIGDKTVPTERRLAALKTMRDLLGKYERLGQDVWGAGAAPPAAAPPAAAAGAYDDPNEEAAYQAWKKSQGL